MSLKSMILLQRSGGRKKLAVKQIGLIRLVNRRQIEMFDWNSWIIKFVKEILLKNMTTFISATTITINMNSLDPLRQVYIETMEVEL